MADMEDIHAALRRFIDAREERDLDKAKATRSEKEYRAQEAEVFEMIKEAKVKGSLKVDLGGDYGEVRFTPGETYYGRILDKEKAMKYFEDRCMVDEMTAPGFQQKRVNEHVRELLEGDGIFPDGLDFYGKRGVSISRKKT